MKIPVEAMMLVAFAVVGCGGSAASPPATDAEVAPPTTNLQTTATSMRVTTVPSTSALVSTPTSAEDSLATSVTTSPTEVDPQLLDAVDRAQTAMLNCMKSLPTPCDQSELESALVGLQLQRFEEASSSGVTAEGEDDFAWSVIDGPTQINDDLAIATFCVFDPIVVTSADGTTDGDAVYSRQEWTLLPVGDTWKVSEIIVISEGASEADGCDV